MGIPIRVDEDLYNEAKSTANAEYRSISGQIGFWARVGKTALGVHENFYHDIKR